MSIPVLFSMLASYRKLPPVSGMTMVESWGARDTTRSVSPVAKGV